MPVNLDHATIHAAIRHWGAFIETRHGTPQARDAQQTFRRSLERFDHACWYPIGSVSHLFALAIQDAYCAGYERARADEENARRKSVRGRS